MAYVVVAYVAMALFSYGLCGYGRCGPPVPGLDVLRTVDGLATVPPIEARVDVRLCVYRHRRYRTRRRSTNRSPC